ncbi:hypothetical protein Taro_027308 [Colocasia esculenta]|uniref:Uncharacterized protein n=1 Tax=Colocasia esculenta TaxID=4460 RepID=A0A843V8D5_COLES|nr:hypothetical protein [Colocasia esculenta]
MPGPPRQLISFQESELSSSEIQRSIPPPPCAQPRCWHSLFLRFSGISVGEEEGMEIGGGGRSGETGGGGSAAAESTVSGLANGSADRGRERRSPSSGSANNKAGKNGSSGGANMGRMLLNSVNKSASQIRKHPHRRSSSPLNWFPRKKTDSFLKRKIKLLQVYFPPCTQLLKKNGDEHYRKEKEGMNTSLDETLGETNPHYTRIAREKFAARAAAKKAMEARRAAMIEASWCRILHAARIHNKEAEDKLQKAEEYVAEAFEAARAMGVMMYDRPDCPRRSCEIETSSATGGASTHKVTASFETAFEVDKEVAAAVKDAFIRLASCSASNKEEFRDLLRKISQNPDVAEMDRGVPYVSMQHESVTGSQVEPELPTSDFSSNHPMNRHDSVVKQVNGGGMLTSDSYRSSQSSQDLVDTMFDRLKRLPEDEIASLAVIVATCGLNAALLEMGKDDNPVNDGTFAQVTFSTKSSAGVGARRLSSVSSFIHGHIKRKEPVAELPSLDKFLVKHITRLEKEVLEAKNSKKTSEVLESVKEASEEQISENGWTNSVNASKLPNSTPDLGSILVKHVSRLERDIQASKNSMKINTLIVNGENAGPSSAQPSESGQSSHLNNETEEANMEKQSEEKSMQQWHMDCEANRDSEKNGAELGERQPICSSDGKDDDKENTDLNKLPSMAGEKVSEGSAAEFEKHKTQLSQTVKHHVPRSERAKLETLRAFSAGNLLEEGEIQEQIGLDKILIKPVHRLEREKMKALEEADKTRSYTNEKCSGTKVMAAESLDKILVQHVSRLEREKMAAKMVALANEEVHQVARTADKHLGTCVESLDQILVKHQSKLEKAKLASAQDRSLAMTVKGKKDLEPEISSEGLGQILVKHQSKLEKAKLAATQDQSLFLRVKGKKHDQQLETCGDTLDQVFVKHQTRLEKAKLAAAEESVDTVKSANTWKEARERELQEAWGGLSLGNTAAWKRAEEEELRRAREV